MINNLLDNLENRASIPYENIINIKSNLNFEVFTDICTILGIDDSKYQLRQKAIDEQLLTQRNKIAHGKYLTIDYEEYINTYNLVIKLIRNFKDDLLNAAVTSKVYRVNTKSVEYALHIRTGKRQETKGEINNQFLITGFSI
jgi:hypothetical protein